MNKMQKIAGYVKVKGGVLCTLVGGGTMFVANSALAALPVGLTAALDGIETDIGLLELAMWPVAIAIALVYFWLRQGKKGIRAVS